MKKCNWIICILGVCIILSGTVFAADKDKSDLPGLIFCRNGFCRPPWRE
jgi:hypothetical protein